MKCGAPYVQDNLFLTFYQFYLVFGGFYLGLSPNANDNPIPKF